MPQRPFKAQAIQVPDFQQMRDLAAGVGLVAAEARTYTDDPRSQDFAHYADGVAAALAWLSGENAGSKLYSVLQDGEDRLWVKSQAERKPS